MSGWSTVELDLFRIDGGVINDTIHDEERYESERNQEIPHGAIAYLMFIHGMIWYDTV